jgi:plastocyanin
VSSPGTYHGQCAELCGTEHAKMTFVVKAVGRTEFDKWFQGFVTPRADCNDTAKAAATATIHSVPGVAKFVEECAYLKAGTAKVTFDNGGGLPHNVAVIEGITPPGKLLAAGKIINSGSETMDVAGLKAGGDYTFYCQVHPQMQGRVVVQ